MRETERDFDVHITVAIFYSLSEEKLRFASINIYSLLVKGFLYFVCVAIVSRRGKARNMHGHCVFVDDP